MDVLEDSPGKAAGFEPGDVILAMNNNFSKDIQAYKAIIQNAGATVRVLVLREGQPKLLTLKVRDIR
jgi:S1-C subfamily serine protease